jgi:uncharacterized protein (DUF362 family)/NAD-dependent dihydropyrimidine dehydrogenase PreA subunit
MSSQISQVIIEPADTNLRYNIEAIMKALAPNTFAGARVLIKPNMVGPSVPELGHTTHPELLRAVVHACLDRGAKVMVGDNPGGMNRSSHHVAAITGILDASEGCFSSISEQVVEIAGAETGLTLVISKAVLEADYIINLPVFKTHVGMMVSGALKNVFGYVAGACKARLHLQAPTSDMLASVICDVHQVRPPDLHIMDAITAIEGNGPCHGGRLRKVGKLIASIDPLALDAVMARMMGVDPKRLPVQKRAQILGIGTLEDSGVDIRGQLVPIPDFKMPVTFANQLGEEDAVELRKLYPSGMMRRRVTVKPFHREELCTGCGDCALNCPTHALTLDPEFSISDQCIACYCCVELCSEGALEVPDVEAFHHY